MRTRDRDTGRLFERGTRHIFDTLYVWDYLARPYRFVPSVAAGMPEISADGRVWTIRIRPGIHFDDDPVFAGKKRELTAADVVYSWTRMMDPRLRSPNTADLEGKLAGLDAAVAKAKASGRFDYDAEIPGLQAIGHHTLRIELVEPDYTFLTGLNDTGLRVVAREVIEKYADAGGRVMDHPVGTGPYRLKSGNGRGECCWRPIRISATSGSRLRRPTPTWRRGQLPRR